MKIHIAEKNLQASGLNARLSSKDVERVHVFIVTKINDKLAIAMAHEKNGLGYSWISGHVEQKDKGDIFQTAYREMKEDTLARLIV